MKRYLFTGFVILLFAFPHAYAQQKTTQQVGQVWLGYFNQTRFSNHWGAWVDLHLRTKEGLFTNFSTGIIRLGLTYYVTEDCKLTAGYAFVNHFPADNHKNISQPEHRPWQQIQWHNKYKRLRTMQWIRLDERYRRKVINDSTLAKGYNFNYRLRYNLLLQYPLRKKKSGSGSFSFIITDEAMINFGKQVTYNYFDQNRFFIGFSYQTTNRNNLQVGYMNVFQQLPAGNQYRSIQGVRIFYFHNIDLRK